VPEMNVPEGVVRELGKVEVQVSVEKRDSLVK
jgi:hypothetical protein